MRQFTVMLVDDDPDDRDVFKEALDSLLLPVNFSSASDGVEALDRIAVSPENRPSILFIDLNMPRLNGHELVGRLRGKAGFDKVPMIIYSTSSAKFDITRALAAGANAYMTKPGSFRLLCQDLRETLNRFLPLASGAAAGG